MDIITNTMKPAQALSYREFKVNMDHLKVTDETVDSYKRSAIIEIMGEQDLIYMPFHFKKDHHNVLRLLFDDVDVPMSIWSIGHPDDDDRECIPVIPMSEEQGKLIIEFIKANSEVNNFIIHCAAGVSRSAGVAKFINEYFGGTDREYYQFNPYTKPNQRILNILRKLSQQ